MKPVSDAQRQSQEIRGLIATGNAASTPQVQAILTRYMQQSRITNEQYHAMKGFGNVYERLGNAVNKYVSGDYSETNKKLILDLVNQMDKSVFDPARKKIVDKYAKQAKAMKIDPSFADDPNAYSGDDGGWKDL